MAWKAYLDHDEKNTTSYDIAIENSENGEIVAYAYEQDEANLIAAAPELLEACKAILRALFTADDDDFKFAENKLETAIAKAEGRDGT